MDCFTESKFYFDKFICSAEGGVNDSSNRSSLNKFQLVKSRVSRKFIIKWCNFKSICQELIEGRFYKG